MALAADTTVRRRTGLRVNALLKLERWLTRM
jgi:hypothetical protein